MDTTPLETALIIFVRHPELGKVKTRLAKVIGDDRTLAVYHLLLKHTLQVTTPLNCRKFVYYTDQIIEHDLWDFPGYTKRQQFGPDLGTRITNAYKELFGQGFKRVMIIGSDCLQLQTPVLQQAFKELAGNDIVLGPAHDGGYYLLGTNQYVPELFENVAWGSSEVTPTTIDTINRLNLSYHLLETLHNVNEAPDLQLSGITL